MPRHSPLPYNPALDGLRALAVAGILCFHSGFGWARGGFLGVSAFFTLSGFLITRLLLREWDERGAIGLRAFWGRRLRRLMPAALLGLLAALLCGALITRPGELPALSRDVIASLFYLANWHFVAAGYDYAEIFRQASPVQHYWSLAIEEQFYLLHPLLLIGLLRLGRGSRVVVGLGLALMALLSLGVMLACQQAGGEIARVYYGTDARAGELLLGALLAVVLPASESRPRARATSPLDWLGGAALGVSLIAWSRLDLAWEILYRGGLLLHALLWILVLAAASRPGRLRALLSLAPLVALGRISYGVYVYHWPILLWLDEARTGLAGGALFALRLGLTLGLAAVSHRLLERPIRERRLLAGRRAPLALAAGMGLVLAATLGMRASLGGDEPDWLSDSRAAFEIAGRGDGPRVMVVGDSVAWSLGGGLRAWAEETGEASVLVRAKPGCAVARGGERRLRSGPRPDRADQCWQAIAAWRDDVARFAPDVVVMVTGGFDLVDRRLPGWSDFRAPGDPEFDAWLLGEYARAADVLSAGGAGLLWLTWPCPQQKEYRGAYGGGTGAFDPARVEHLNRRLLPRLASMRGERMRIVDLFARVCHEGRFSHRFGPFEHAREDGLHFALAEARWLADWLAPQIHTLARRTASP